MYLSTASLSLTGRYYDICHHEERVILLTTTTTTTTINTIISILFVEQ